MTRFSLLLLGLFRKPTRTTLTILSLTIAFLLFMLLRAVNAAFEGGVTAQGPQRVFVDSKYSLVDNLPIAHLQQMAEIDGVKTVVPFIWFGGYYQNPSNDFPKLVVGHDAYLESFPDVLVADDVMSRFRQSRRSVLVAQPLIDRFGWRVGDLIPIQGNIWPKEDNSYAWEFELAGAYTLAPGSRSQAAFLIRYDYFNESAIFWIKDQVGSAIVLLEQGVDPKTIIDRIDSHFENSSDPTRSLSEDDYSRQFANQLGDMGVITTLILAAVFFTILLLSGNVALLSTRERIPELAVMKTLGFESRSLAFMVVGESLLLTSIGAIAGISLGFLIEPWLNGMLALVLGQFEMTWQHAAQALIIAVLLGLAIGLPSSLTVRQTSIVDALRERE